jgi:hypothetical protein
MKYYVKHMNLKGYEEFKEVDIATLKHIQEIECGLYLEPLVLVEVNEEAMYFEYMEYEC